MSFDPDFIRLLILKDPGYFKVFFSEKWILSYQIFFQVKIQVFYMKAEMFSWFLTPWSMFLGSKHSC